MARTEKIQAIDVKGDFTVCPRCGYDGGFHGIFPGYGVDRPSKWILMCPNCKARYDIGLTVSGPE